MWPASTLRRLRLRHAPGKRGPHRAHPRRTFRPVTVLGNAAGSGALRYATEEGAAESALGIIRRTRYIELSAHAGFTDAYVERMLFPERE